MCVNTTTTVHFILYMTNLTVRNPTVIPNVLTATECCMKTISVNSTSFFYNRQSKDCVVNQMTPSATDFIEGQGYRYFSKNVPPCGPAPAIENATLVNITFDGDDVYTAHYTCPMEYHYMAVSTSTCTGTTWSAGAECKVIETCTAIKACNPEYTSDGEYWLYPRGANHHKTKLYCKGMNTANPTEYLTFHGVNYAESPRGEYSGSGCGVQTGDWTEYGKTVFDKVRIDVQTMTVERTDYSFTNQEYDNPVPYGNARACSKRNFGTCPQRGNAKLNLTLTGLIFSPTTEWKQQGWQPLWTMVQRTDHEVHVIGDGACGGSMPTGTIELQTDPSYSPPLISAIQPTCV